MSKISAPDPAKLDHELIAPVGTGAATPIRDPEAEDIADLLGTIRRQVLSAAQEDGVSTREIARRLGVSAAAVSRQLRSDHDLRVSTVVLLARALDRHWSLTLKLANPSTRPTNITAPRPSAAATRPRPPAGD